MSKALYNVFSGTDPPWSTYLGTMRKILKQDFFNRSAVSVSRDLLGKFLVRKIDRKKLAFMIVETEAYDGPHDKASHAHKGRTARTEVMFGPPGYFYVYLCYGMYWMLNVVTGPKDYPAAVLIRGLYTEHPMSSILNGPGKLTKFLYINKNLNGFPSIPHSGLWIEDRGVRVSKNKTPWRIRRTPRIGVAYAGKWAKKQYRFVLKTK